MISGPAVHAAEENWKAYRSAQQTYLDGQQIQLEAYTIGGNNYVKLRDIGEALDFNVFWDGAARIDSEAQRNICGRLAELPASHFPALIYPTGALVSPDPQSPLEPRANTETKCSENY